jgi:hypothetical protein
MPQVPRSVIGVWMIMETGLVGSIKLGLDPLRGMPGKRAQISAGKFAHNLAGSACGRARLFCAAPVFVTVLRKARG